MSGATLAPGGPPTSCTDRRSDELQIASRRTDGTLRSFVTIWVVRSGDDIYVRSAYGTENPWYRRALASGRGRIKAGGVERDVPCIRHGR